MGWDEDRTDQSSRRAPAARPLVATLVVLHGPRGVAEPRTVVLSPGETTIGRAAAPRTIQLEDARVSRRHALVEVSPRGAVLRDMASSHGTFVGSARIETPRVLADGDVIRTGDSFLLFRVRPLDAPDAPIAGLSGSAPAIAQLRSKIALVAPTDVNVLVIGESGTGKELVAQAIHEMSARRGRFVAVNTSAIPESLAESHLFGHAAGAFTGAKTSHPGYFEQAAGGTLFLDEIGEMPLPLQAKLLRVIEERAVVPVGATQPRAVDVRIVAATHRSLESAVERGTFRGDLFARLSDVLLRTPALRERREDVLPLLARTLGPHAPPLDPDLVEALLLHGWPYNVRELIKIATELRVLGAGSATLDLSMIASRLGRRVDTGPLLAPSAIDEPTQVTAKADTRPPPREPEPEPRDAPSPEVVSALYREHEGNISRIARALGRSRRQVHRYLEAAGLRKKGDPDDET
ncbi:sigma 54-interacting transcriptional regulator [Sandaracinus amylolyticus]|uniref:Flagellar regulatory protein FleQ n=1 Tax=Sandaracinus amylolyticus TaxID=927083 RepID=A0A0F6YHE9_9BACT|nr:sigma 54-interacting transcriptional regulator [Sandaracinus amylolyticus]AKF05028.1 Flagellar regulatory protein FleQ [Sandaracinus amylolyticus]